MKRFVFGGLAIAAAAVMVAGGVVAQPRPERDGDKDAPREKQAQPRGRDGERPPPRGEGDRPRDGGDRGRPPMGPDGGPPRFMAGKVLPPFMERDLDLTDEQRKQLADLEKSVADRLGKILTKEQLEKVQNFRPMGPGGRPGEGRPGEGRPGGGRPEGRPGEGGGRPPRQDSRMNDGEFGGPPTHHVVIHFAPPPPPRDGERRPPQGREGRDRAPDHIPQW